MAKREIPAAENQAYENRRTMDKIGAQFAALSGNEAARLFIRDFQAIAHAITDPVSHKLPEPHGIADLPPFRTYAARRRLPVGALRRMARLIGVDSLRYLFGVCSEQDSDLYRLELRPRLDKEFRRGNYYKKYDEEATLLRFGNTVLMLERDQWLTRNEALAAAARQLGIAAGSARSHERYFYQFRRLCELRGYVPSSLGLMMPPSFALADLSGRPSDKPQK